jgi:hypothetical protein
MIGEGLEARLLGREVEAVMGSADDLVERGRRGDDRSAMPEERPPQPFLDWVNLAGMRYVAPTALNHTIVSERPDPRAKDIRAPGL